MHVGLVLVEVGMFSTHAWVGRENFSLIHFIVPVRFSTPSRIKHQTHGKFHGQAGARRNCQAK